jgi:hypothetical protein
MAIVVLFALAAFVLAAAAFGKDSRDSNDWACHPRA